MNLDLDFDLYLDTDLDRYQQASKRMVQVYPGILPIIATFDCDPDPHPDRLAVIIHGQARTVRIGRGKTRAELLPYRRQKLRTRIQ